MCVKLDTEEGDDKAAEGIGKAGDLDAPCGEKMEPDYRCTMTCPPQNRSSCILD